MHLGLLGTDVTLWVWWLKCLSHQNLLPGVGLPSQVDSLALILLLVQDLQSLHHDATSDDSVGGGNGWDDVAGHALDLEPALVGNVEDLHADVGARCDEVERW